eukprot:620747-Rhodomonas_salina.1
MHTRAGEQKCIPAAAAAPEIVFSESEPHLSQPSSIVPISQPDRLLFLVCRYKYNVVCFKRTQNRTITCCHGLGDPSITRPSSAQLAARQQPAPASSSW